MQKFSTIFFDLDDTLYDKGNGLWDAIAFRMSEYIQDLLQLSMEDVDNLRRDYYETYGTTLRGLQINHEVNSDEYLEYVHELKLERYIQSDPDLYELISGLPQRKFIFTNADSAHALRVVDILGLNGCFEGIIDVRALNFHCKPEQEAYRLALKLAGGVDAENCLYLDDSTRNLAPARNMGFTTVLVGNNRVDPAANFSISNLKELSEALPALWTGDE